MLVSMCAGLVHPCLPVQLYVRSVHCAMAAGHPYVTPYAFPRCYNAGNCTRASLHTKIALATVLPGILCSPTSIHMHYLRLSSRSFCAGEVAICSFSGIAMPAQRLLESKQSLHDLFAPSCPGVSSSM